MYMRCLYVLHNVCGKVLIMCGKVCDLNVLRPCDLSVHFITSPRKCQHRRYKFCQGLTTQKYQSLL